MTVNSSLFTYATADFLRAAAVVNADINAQSPTGDTSGKALVTVAAVLSGGKAIPNDADHPIYVANAAGGGAVTIADGADVAEGATSAAAYADATGAAAGTVVGLSKGLYVLTAAMSAKLPASLGIKAAAASLSVAPASDANFIAIGNVASGAADSGAPVKGGGKFNATLPTFSDGQRGDLQVSSKGRLLVAIGNTNAGADGLLNSTVVFAQGQQDLAAAGGVYAIANHVFNGTSWDRQRGDTNGIAVQAAPSATFWNYAAASGGILNTTTAVTLKAAAGASVRNYLKSMQLRAQALGAATEIAIRDGAGGAVLWRGEIGTGGLDDRTFNFDPPLKGTANTLLEFVTLTASVTGAVYVNAQGYTGS